MMFVIDRRAGPAHARSAAPGRRCHLRSSCAWPSRCSCACSKGWAPSTRPCRRTWPACTWSRPSSASASRVDRFARHNDDYMDENIRVGQIVAVALPALTILTNLGIVAVVWFGGRDVIAGRDSRSATCGLQQLPADRHGPADAPGQHPDDGLPRGGLGRTRLGGAGHGTGRQTGGRCPARAPTLRPGAGSRFDDVRFRYDGARSATSRAGRRRP